MTLNIKWDGLEVHRNNRTEQLNQQIIYSLENQLGFHKVMPIQKAVIPLFSANKDVAVEAATGSGKTLAFLVSLLQHYFQDLKQNNSKTKIYGLIVSPTRELARQTFIVTQQLVKTLGTAVLDVQLVCGGDKKKQETRHGQVQGLDTKQDSGLGRIVIGTPGKLREKIQKLEQLDRKMFSDLEYLVLDEADRLVQQSNHLQDINYIISRLPKQRRTGLFSATLGDQIEKDPEFLQRMGLRNPVLVKLSNQKSENQNNQYIPEQLKNHYLLTESRVDKIIFTLEFVSQHLDKKTIIFFNTISSVRFYYKIYGELLTNSQVLEMHGQMKQSKREKIYDRFKTIKNGVLVCTDVCARGVDFENVNYIIQVDPPQDPNQFVHRIGRTARVGRTGDAILLLDQKEDTFIYFLKNKGIQLQEYLCSWGSDYLANKDDYKNRIKQFVVADKDHIELSKKAFVSFLRSYQEHELKYVFQFKNLQIGDIANSFFLLSLPRVKEILGKKIEGFENDKTVDLNQIEFKDKNKEKQFIEKKQRNQMKKQEKIEQKQLQKNLKVNQKYNPKQKDIKNNSVIRRKIKREIDEKEQEDFAAELRLQKKLKQGKISKDEFNRRMRELDGDDYLDE